MTDEAQPTETRGRMIRGWMARFYDVMSWGSGEIYRVLKPDGRLLAVDFTSGRSLIGRVMGFLGHAHKLEGLNGIKSMLAEAGFSTVEELPSKQGHLFYLRAQKMDR